MRHHILSIITVGLMMTSVSWAEDQTPPLSLELFTQKVLAYYPGLKAAHGDVDVALARQMQAKAGFWPTLDLVAGYKVTNDPVDVFGTLLHQERFTSSDFDLKRLNTPDRHQDLSAGVRLDLPLFDAMQTIYRARAAGENVKAAGSDEAVTRMEARLMAQDAYLNAVTLRELAMVVNEVCKSADADLQKAKDLKDRGMVLGADYYAARVMSGELTRVKNDLARQDKAMRALLNIMMGESMAKAWALPVSLQAEDVPSEDASALMTMALARRPDLQALELRLKALDMDVSRARAGDLPRVSVFADAAGDRDKVFSSGGKNFTVGLKGELALFDPARAGRVREAQARAQRLGYEIQSLKDDIQRAITGELARHEAWRDNLVVLKSMSEDARQAVTFMVPLYSEGRRSIKDLIEARRAYLQAVEAYDKAVTGLWLSRGRLLFMAGALDEDQMKQLTQGAGL